MYERLKEIKSNRHMYGKDGCKWFAIEINIDDFDYLIQTIEQQQEEIERLKTIEEAYEALKKSL